MAGTARLFALWLLAGGCIGLVLALAVMFFMVRDRTPTLTPKEFYEARERWEAAAPQDYDIEIRVSGSQPATYRVEVRDGIADVALRNERPLTQRRTFGTWSVPGMFSTISRDIEAIERRAAGKADASTPRLILRAEFDPQYSYPAKYRRIESGSPVEVSWEVTHFRVYGEKIGK